MAKKEKEAEEAEEEEEAGSEAEEEAAEVKEGVGIEVKEKIMIIMIRIIKEIDQKLLMMMDILDNKEGVIEEVGIVENTVVEIMKDKKGRIDQIGKEMIIGMIIDRIIDKREEEPEAAVGEENDFENKKKLLIIKFKNN